MNELNKIIEMYLKNCEVVKELNKKTLKAYRIDLLQFECEIMSRQELENRSILNNYIANLHKKYQPRTTKRKIACIKAFYRYLEFEELIQINPFDKINIKFREPIQLPRVIPSHVIESLINEIYKQRVLAKTDYQRLTTLRDITIIELLFATGLRISELCSLTDCQVDLVTNNLLIYGKGSKERMIQIGNSDVKKILLEYHNAFNEIIQSSGWFFVNRFQKRFSEQSVREMIVKYMNLTASELHITPHMFRHPPVKLKLKIILISTSSLEKPIQTNLCLFYLGDNINKISITYHYSCFQVFLHLGSLIGIASAFLQRYLILQVFHFARYHV